MRQYIDNVQLALQELSLRSIDMMDKLPIQNILDEMNLAINDLPPSPERLILKSIADKLERVLK